MNQHPCYGAHRFAFAGRLQLWRPKPDTPGDFREGIVRLGVELAPRRITGRQKQLFLPEIVPLPRHHFAAHELRCRYALNQLFFFR